MRCCTRPTTVYLRRQLAGLLHRSMVLRISLSGPRRKRGVSWKEEFGCACGKPPRLLE